MDNQHIGESPCNIKVKLPVHMLETPIRIISEHEINEPSCLTVNEKGEILVVEEGNQYISVFTPDGTNLYSFGSPVPMGQRILSRPHDVLVWKDGKKLVTDSGNNCISVFISDGSFEMSVGEHGSDPLQFKQPMGIAIHPKSKHVYVTDYKNDRIQVVSCDLSFVATFGSGGMKLGEFIQPWDVSFDSNGLMYTLLIMETTVLKSLSVGRFVIRNSRH